LRAKRAPTLRNYSPPRTRAASRWPWPFDCSERGTPPTELNTEAAVTLEQDKESFRITRSALTLRASVPNLDPDTFSSVAQDAEQNCPISRVLKAEITLDAKLV
jgi:lipoyl-dependent peroxiredoxin